MRKMIPGCALVLLGIALSASAQAQWKWRDASGQINYSDQPPPVSVPAARILSIGAAAPPTAQAGTADAAASATPAGSAAQLGAGAGTAAQPAVAAASGAAAGQPGATAGAPGAAPARPTSSAERLTERRKRQAEKEAAEQKAREQEQLEARVAQWCEDLRGRERLLESGMRVASVQANGEQTFMEDEEREAQLRAVRRDLQEKCSSGS